MTNIQDSVFTRIQLLPLFQGINQEELMRMLERTRFNFVSVDSGEIIIEQGKSSSQLIYVLSGKVSAFRTFTPDFSLEEELEGPLLFQAESLFSTTLTWNYTLQALTDVQLLLISKQDLVAHLIDFHTFRLSLLCHLGRLLETKQNSLSEITPKYLVESIVDFWSSLMICKEGKKIIYIGMQTLANKFSTSRLSISKCLNQLQKQGLLKLGRQTISIHKFENLLNKKRE